MSSVSVVHSFDDIVYSFVWRCKCEFGVRYLQNHSKLSSLTPQYPHFAFVCIKMFLVFNAYNLFECYTNIYTCFLLTSILCKIINTQCE